MRLIRHRARATGDKQVLNPLFNQPAPDERYPAKNRAGWYGCDYRIGLGRQNAWPGRPGLRYDYIGDRRLAFWASQSVFYAVAISAILMTLLSILWSNHKETLELNKKLNRLLVQKRALSAIAAFRQKLP
jgi:hypothetical protein